MIEAERLADRLQDIATVVRRDGPVAWERVEDWTVARMPAHREPLDDDQEERARSGRSEVDEDDRREDAAAARYKDELRTVVSRVVADLNRVETIISVCCPTPSKHLSNRDLLVAQVAAEGFCVSCWRDDQFLFEIELQGNGTPYYKDLCRWCGSWKGNHGSIPPTWIVAKHHRGRISSADVEKATGKAS